MNTLTCSVYVAIAQICFQNEVINYDHIEFTFSHSRQHLRSSAICLKHADWSAMLGIMWRRWHASRLQSLLSMCVHKEWGEPAFKISIRIVKLSIISIHLQFATKL